MSSLLDSLWPCWAWGLWSLAGEGTRAPVHNEAGASGWSEHGEGQAWKVGSEPPAALDSWKALGRGLGLWSWPSTRLRVVLQRSACR